MSKKMKILIAVLVAILTLTVSGAMAVLAQDGEETEFDEEELIEELDEIAPRVRLFMASIESNELLSRVSDILGISEEELSDAFTQAKQEMMAERCEEAFYEFLDRAVAEELLTEGEAQGIKEWWEQKPEALNSAQLRNALCIMRSNPELRMEILEQAIEEGLISEEEATEIMAWTGNRPAALSQLSPKPQIMNSVRGRHMIAVRKGWHGPLPYQNTD